jgi:hypothetical protein
VVRSPILCHMASGRPRIIGDHADAERPIPLEPVAGLDSILGHARPYRRAHRLPVPAVCSTSPDRDRHEWRGDLRILPTWSSIRDPGCTRSSGVPGRSNGAEGFPDAGLVQDALGTWLRSRHNKQRDSFNGPQKLQVSAGSDIQQRIGLSRAPEFISTISRFDFANPNAKRTAAWGLGVVGLAAV